MNVSDKSPEGSRVHAGTGAQNPDTVKAAIQSKKTVAWLYVIGIGLSWAAIGIIPLIIANVMMYFGFGRRCLKCGKWWARLADSGTFLRNQTKTAYWPVQVKDKNIHDAAGRIVGYTSKDEVLSWSYEIEIWHVNYHCCFCAHRWDGIASGASEEFRTLKAPEAASQCSPQTPALEPTSTASVAECAPITRPSSVIPPVEAQPKALSRRGLSVHPHRDNVAKQLTKVRVTIIAGVAVILSAMVFILVSVRARETDAGSLVRDPSTTRIQHVGSDTSVLQKSAVVSSGSELSGAEPIEPPKNEFLLLSERAKSEQDRDKALTLWKRARGAAQNDRDVQVASQWISQLSEQLAQAEIDGEYRALTIKGQAAFDSGSRDAAEQYWKQALRIRPGSEAQQGLKRVQEARAEYDAAIAEAQKAERSGDSDRASRSYKKALNAKPGDSNASRALDLLSKAPFDELAEISKAHSGFISAIAFSTDGRFLASGGSDKSISLWSVPVPQKTFGLVGRTWVHALAFSLDGRFLASGGDDRTVRLWDAKDGSERGVFIGHTREIRGLTFDASGGVLISGDAGGVLKVWDVVSKSELRTFKSHSNVLSGLAVSPDGRTAIVCSGSIALFDVGTGKLIRKLGDVEGGLGVMAISQDGTRVAAATPNNGYPNPSIHVWNLSSKNETAVFRKPEFGGAVNSIVFSPDGKMLVSSHYNDREGTLNIWDVDSRKVVKSFRASTQSIDCLSFSRDGGYLAGGTHEAVKIWKGLR